MNMYYPVTHEISGCSILADVAKSAANYKIDAYEFVKDIMTNKSLQYIVTMEQSDGKPTSALYREIMKDRSYPEKERSDPDLLWLAGYLYSYWAKATKFSSMFIWEILPLKLLEARLVKYKDKSWEEMLNTAMCNYLEDSNKFVGFWKTSDEYGCFSNWYNCDFVDEEGIKYCSSEQYMMYQKAKLFKDNDIADKIMCTKDNKEIKALGRKVHNFDDNTWVDNRYSIMTKGLYLKFSQNTSLKGLLLGTGDAVIAECSPYDRIWGIGLSLDDSRVLHSSKWRGSNLLGWALMDVRAQLKQDK